MDKKRSVLNVTVSVFFKIILLLGALFVRRTLIRLIGNDLNGLASLFVSIIGFLTVAELGVGEAISFCMYRPIVDGDRHKLAALYRLFRRLYLIIGGVISLLGLAVMPALPYLARDIGYTGVNLYLSFGLTLLSVVLTYGFGARSALIKAHKSNYIATSVHSVGALIEYGSQIAVVYITRSFELYLVCRIVSALLQWAAYAVITEKKYPDILHTAASSLDGDTRSLIVKNVKAMFLHSLGGALVNTSDSLIISAFIGVALLGTYSNYTAVITAMTGVLALFFTPLTSVIGHLFVGEGAEKTRDYFGFFYGLNYLLACVFFLGYYAVIDCVIAIFFGEGLLLERSVTLVLTLNFFLQFMRRSTLLFRDATGTFYNDRLKPFIEGTFNVALSIIFVKPFGIAGVLIATVITNLLICYTVEPYVLFKHAFGASPRRFYLSSYIYAALFCVMLPALDALSVDFSNPWLGLLVNGFIAVGLSLLPAAVLLISCEPFRRYLFSLIRKIKHNR